MKKQNIVVSTSYDNKEIEEQLDEDYTQDLVEDDEAKIEKINHKQQ